MITKEQAVEIVKKYVSNRNRDYIEIVKDKVNYEEKKYINYGKYEEQERTVYTVTCRQEGYLDPISHYVIVDAEKGEVLFTATPHGYAEEWEN